MRLVLIRHGQTDSNLSGALDTAWPGAALNGTGLVQAAELPGKYRRLVGVRPARILSSHIRRAVQTAAPLAQFYGLEARQDENLREIIAGDLEMSTSEFDTQVYLETAMAWAGGGDLERRMPGAQNGRETLRRFDQAISGLFAGLSGEDTAVAVVHGAIMRVWSANRIRGLSLDLLAQFPCQNAAITVAEGSVQSGWEAKLWSDKPLDFWPVQPGASPRSSKDAQQVV